MAKILHQRVFVGGLDLSRRLHTIDVDGKIETQANARMGDNSAVVIGTRHTCELQFGGFWDPVAATAVDGALFSELGEIRPWAVACEKGEEGERAYLGNAVLTARSFGGAHGSNPGMTLAGMTRDTPPIQGILLRLAEGFSAGGDGDPYEFIAVPAGKKLWAALFVFAGAGIDIDVTVESDEDANFDGSESERIDFGNITGVGGHLLTADGPITDEFYRVVIAVNGGTGISLAVAIGVW